MPMSEEWDGRTIDICRILDQGESPSKYEVKKVIMTDYRDGSIDSSLMALTDKGFFRIGRENILTRTSIDSIQGEDGLVALLEKSLRKVMDSHL